ncbi:MAG: zinc-dependent metalloprotease, partial [Mycobacteriaceae bacterium]
MSTEKTDSTKSLTLGAGIDWEFAEKVGTRLVRSGPTISRYTDQQARTELAELSVQAEGPVREVTGLADGLIVPQAQIVDRIGWLQAAAKSMELLSGSDDTSKGFLFGKLGGAQAGAVLSYLSTAILGQYDPFAEPDGMLLLV